MQSSLILNSGFWRTIALLCVAGEVLLRVLPHVSESAFRIAYGNSLSIYLAIEQRLASHGAELELIALGDSLAMTQFEPEIFELEGGRAPGSVFNAAYLGMTFPSLEALLVSVQKETLPKLDTVLFFVNPRRLSSLETPSEDVFRIGIPEPDGALSLALGRKQVAPLLDASRLYGLSRHLLLQSWRDALSGRVTFDHVELLGDHGGAVWAPSRSDPATPVYPYRQVEAISEERVDEVRRVLALLDAWGVETLLLTSPVHPDVEVFASPAAAAAYEATMERIAREHSAHFWPGLGSAFAPSDELSFTDYGHMNDTGAREYTTMLARSARLPLSRSWEK